MIFHLKARIKNLVLDRATKYSTIYDSINYLKKMMHKCYSHEIFGRKL